MILSISSFEIISVVKLDLKTFFWIAASVADAVSVNPNDIKILLANGSSTIFIKSKLVFSDGPKILPKNSPNSTILSSWLFDNLIGADELNAKASQSLETYLLVNNN